MMVPQELVTNILSCLPVKSLLRFKCGCSSWYHLITSPFFVNLHLITAAALKLKGNHNYTILTESSKPVSKWGTIPDPDLSLVSGDTFHLIREVTLPYFGKPLASAPCNGLFCLIGKIENSADHTGDDVALWNPATRKLSLLPHCPFPGPGRRYYLENFGFGAISSDSDYDYKVVKIVYREDWYVGINGEEYSYDYEAYVYSSKKNCWTEVTVPPTRDTVVESHCSIYHNGSYYWFSRYGNSLISFDMHSHVFHVSQLPIEHPIEHNGDPWMANFAVQNDSLVIVLHRSKEVLPNPRKTRFHHYFGLASIRPYEIFVLDEVSNSWSHQSRKDNDYPFMHTRVRVNDTAIGHDDGDHLVSYNLKTQEHKRIRVYFGIRVEYFIIVPFIESLVFANVGEALPEDC